MAVLGPHLPAKYAPLRANGAGLQGVYLTHLPETFAATLIDLLGAEARSLVMGHYLAEEQPEYAATGVGLVQWEEPELKEVQADATWVDTEKQEIVVDRRGRGQIGRAAGR